MSLGDVFDPIFNLIATALSFFYDQTNSYGVGIMLLTLAVMILVTPLTLKSTRSMIAMQRLQPELRKLQNKYKDDRQKLNEEMMAFYKEHNINPLGGCLPLVVQMPVFFVLYRVLIGLTDKRGYGQDMGTAVGGTIRDPGSTFSGFGTFDPGHLDSSSPLYRALSNAREMRSFGLDLADSASNVLSAEGMVNALPYIFLIAVIGLTSWYQQKQIQARTPQGQSQINPQQQAIMKVLPFFLPVISFTLPAGIVLYFLVSNLYRIGQQAFITKTMYGDGILHRAHDDDGDEGKTQASETTSTKVPKRSDVVPRDRKSLLGGLVQLPQRGNGSSSPGQDGRSAKTPAKGAPPKATTAKPAAPGGATTKSKPSRSAPRTPASAAKAAPSRRPPAQQNRSKKKKKRT